MNYNEYLIQFPSTAWTFSYKISVQKQEQKTISNLEMGAALF
jgi:hypothetical protein